MLSKVNKIYSRIENNINYMHKMTRTEKTKKYDEVNIKNEKDFF